MKSVTLVSAGTLAVVLNVVPSTTAVADAIQRSGTQHSMGLPGPNGATSADRDRGPKGDRGQKGERGPRGFQGPQGFQGAPGVPGEEGPQGAQGAQGFQGAPGAQGPQGFQGTPGAVELETYVVTGEAGGESTALCGADDVATGGGYQGTGLLAVNVERNEPVFTGTGPATGWQAFTTIGEVVAFAICHDA